MIKKFSSFVDARRDQWVFSPDDDYYIKIRNLYNFAFKFVSPRSRRGVYKYRSLSEANEQEEKYDSNQ